MLFNVFIVSATVTVAAAQLSFTVSAISKSILSIASPTILSHISLHVSSSVVTTAVASLISIPPIASSIVSSTILLPATSTAAPIFLRLIQSWRTISQNRHVSCSPSCLSSTDAEPVVVNQLSSVSKPSPPNTFRQEPVIAFLRERLMRRDAKFAKWDDTSIALKDFFLELKSPPSAAALAEATPFSRVVTL